MTGREPALGELAGDLIRRLSPSETLRLKFGDIAVALQSNDRLLIEQLASYFQGFVAHSDETAAITVTALESPQPDFDLEFAVKQPDPGKTKIKEEFLDLPGGRVVRKRLTGMHFLFGPGVNLAVGPCRDNDNQVINFINNRLIQWELNNGALLAHAAAVKADGRGLALAGFSGMGKSTLALHLMSRGADLCQ